VWKGEGDCAAGSHKEDNLWIVLVSPATGYYLTNNLLTSPLPGEALKFKDRAEVISYLRETPNSVYWTYKPLLVEVTYLPIEHLPEFQLGESDE